MNAEFNWWLLIVGLVVGAALTWLVMAETTRRDADVTEAEQRGEALWIASMLSTSGRDIDSPGVEEILRLHREYLAAPPPDEPAPPEVEVPPQEESGAAAEASEAAGEPKVPAAPDGSEAVTPPDDGRLEGRP